MKIDFNMQYSDLAIQQSQLFQNDIIELQLAYWKQQLANTPGLLALPTDRPRPAAQSFQQANQSFTLSRKLTEGLSLLSQREEVTLFMTLLAAFDSLLYRYTGSEDILVGSPIANRNHFVNILVLRTNISGNPSFRELLSRVREVALQAYAHQDLPYEILVEALQPKRDLSYSPLFQVMLVFEEHTSIEAAEILKNDTTKFDLTLCLEHTTQGLVGVWKYNTELFDASTISRMSGHFQTLLTEIVAHPEQTLCQLPLLTANEQYQLLVEWNDNQVDYPQDKCIHQLFSEQVERTPDTVAVVFEKEQLTYKELNSRSNQLAHYLQNLGVGPEVLVGICVERSIEMVVALLAILKAGGAYVPLDPGYPQERLAYMVSDAQVSVLLTQQRQVAIAEYQGQVVYLDTQWSVIAQESEENIVSRVKPENLAYVIYTSGSTGKPKGVEIIHYAVVNFLNSMSQEPGLTSQDVLLNVTTLSFDIAALELFLPLTIGARVVLVSREVATDGSQLLARMVNHGVTIMQATPATWRLLLEAGWSSSNQLKIMCGGEALSKELSNKLLARSASVWNLYGPTETTIWSVVCEIKFDDGNKLSIGRPIANTQIYILDRHMQPVPIGVPGEIYIGGAGLARGYLNRPELTQEKFILNPLINQPQTRLYKTGDLGRYLTNGNIEYIGRIDNQVKIRGFRIELGDIEAVLSQHQAVQQTVVISREDIPGDKRLVAYIVCNQEEKPTIRNLRRFLSKKLPEYMLPSGFVFLEALPLTPNGKIDRSSLPTPEYNRQLSANFVAPRTPLEEMVARIWVQVLKIEEIGIYDNFFELGGHSLLATSLISRVRSHFQAEIPLYSLFQAATVADFSQYIQQWQQGRLELSPPPLLPVNRDNQLPLSFAQQRLWFLDQLQPNTAFYNITTAIRLQGKLNIAVLEQSFQEIISRHEALRTNVIRVDGQPVQITHSQYFWSIPVLDLQGLPETEREIEVQRLVIKEGQYLFELATEPLIRSNLLLISETEQVLILTIHHIVFDGWSMGVMMKELTTIYQALCEGQPSPLPELAIQYADFAVWQRQWLKGDIIERQLAYWKQQLANAPALLALPTDRLRPAVQTFHGASQSFSVCEELTQALSLLSKAEGVTLFMTLLTAFDTLLYRYTGSEDILVGSPIANRNHQEIESLIGFFVNTLVLRTDLSGNPSFQQLLSRVREVALQAYTHQDLPFELLVEALQPKRDLSYSPLFQVMFVFGEDSFEKIQLPGLTLSNLGIESSTVKFDLTLFLEQTTTGLMGRWEYNTDLFDTNTISRMSGHFQTLLHSIVLNPQQSIGELSLLTTDEQQLLDQWNDTQTEYSQDKCIHELFEQQVVRTPDTVAVVFAEEQLTYQQLNDQANQLAHYLMTLGVGPEVLVGICVQRSLEMLVGIFAILKAGGVYVPLDPDYPSERIQFMLEDAQVQVLLTQQQLMEINQNKAVVVCMDRDSKQIAQQSKANIISKVKPDNLAYVIYTSGSTGIPKGVAIEHRSVLNLCKGLEQGIYHQYQRQLRVSLNGSLSFDTSVKQWVQLLQGHTIEIIPQMLRFDGNALLSYLQKHHIDVFDCTPSQLELLIGAGLLLSDHVPELILIGGEALSLSRWQTLAQSRKIKFYNVYGPTECTVDATLCDLQCHLQPTIGRPISNTKVYILDPYLQPVPVGVTGEIYIGGAGLARGYLNRPELTQAKFIPNPFIDDPQARIYKTGDLARYLSNGNIEYLGRVDKQVKIRGFRIELAEIEALLGQHPVVKQVVVVVRENTPGNKSLVAYIVPNQNQIPTNNELRHFLSEKLPAYMIPAVFVMLDTLPLTPSGKVDTSALPAPNYVRQELENTFIPPRNQLEEQLAKIWQRLLGIQSIGVKDNFFELGGHSLLAVRLMAEIENNLGKSLPLATLFAAQTIEQLGSVLNQKDLISWSCLVPIQTIGTKPPLFCIHAAWGNILFYKGLVSYLQPDQPVYGIQARGIDGEDPSTSVTEMAAHYIKEIRTVQPYGPYFLGGHSFGGIIAFEIARQLDEQGENTALLAIFDTSAPVLNDTQTIKFHWHQLLELKLKDQLSYLWERLNWHLRIGKINIFFKLYLRYIKCSLPEIRLLDVALANNIARKSYVPKIYPGKLTLFRATEIPVEEFEFDEDLGWNQLAIGGVEIYESPGKHTTVMQEPNVKVLAENLTLCLQQALDSV